MFRTVDTNQDHPATLATIARNLHTEAQEFGDLALAERLQLQEALHASSGEQDFVIDLPKDDGISAFAQLLEQQALMYQASSDFYAAREWSTALEHQERQDHELAVLLSQDERGARQAMRNATEVELPSLESLVLVEKDQDKGKQAVSYECGICLEPFDIRHQNVPSGASTSKQPPRHGMHLTCGHGYCDACMHTFIQVRLGTFGAPFPITCPQPDCDQPILLPAVQNILSVDERTKFQVKVYESSITNKLYCPNPTCNKLMDGDVFTNVKVRCDLCSLLFCKACKVPFHDGYTCTEYKALSYGGDAAHDQAVSQLAAKNKWRPCPQCSAVVERTDGCKHMRCPCGVQFCYACGAKWARSNCSKNCRG